MACAPILDTFTDGWFIPFGKSVPRSEMLFLLGLGIYWKSVYVSRSLFSLVGGGIPATFVVAWSVY